LEGEEKPGNCKHKYKYKIENSIEMRDANYLWAAPRPHAPKTGATQNR